MKQVQKEVVIVLLIIILVIFIISCTTEIGVKEITFNEIFIYNSYHQTN